jgi:hypothetical protein
VLSMPETECFHTRGLQISPHGTSITGPVIGNCLQGNVSSADRAALGLRRFGRLGPCQLITHGYFDLLGYGPDLINDVANQYINAINSGFGLIKGDVTWLLNVLIILSIMWSAALANVRGAPPMRIGWVNAT